MLVLQKCLYNKVQYHYYSNSAHFFLSSLLVGNGDVIQLNVINGTKWVGLGGNVETFEAVIGRPPMTSSDITLKQALSRINQVISY